MASKKSKIIAALLAFFLSAFGADDFYVGNNTAGIIRIIVLVVTVVGAAALVIVGIEVQKAVDASTPALAMMGGGAVGLIVLGGLILGIWGLINVIKYLVMSDERFQEMVSANSKS